MAKERIKFYLFDEEDEPLLAALEYVPAFKGARDVEIIDGRPVKGRALEPDEPAHYKIKAIYRENGRELATDIMNRAREYKPLAEKIEEEVGLGLDGSAGPFEAVIDF